MVIPTVLKPVGNAIDTDLSYVETQSLHLVSLYRELHFTTVIRLFVYPIRTNNTLHVYSSYIFKHVCQVTMASIDQYPVLILITETNANISAHVIKTCVTLLQDVNMLPKVFSPMYTYTFDA